MWSRALAVWLLIIACETVLGTVRQLVLAPMLGEGARGDVLARRIGLVVGTAMIFTITWFTVRWMCGVRSHRMSRQVAPASAAPHATTHPRTISSRRLILIGVLWALLTFAFEVGIGRLMAMGQTPDGGWSAVWSRLGEDYDLTRGGLMALGLVAMALCPLLAAHLRDTCRA